MLPNFRLLFGRFPFFAPLSCYWQQHVWEFECRALADLKAKISLNYSQGSGPYRAVNTACLGYEIQNITVKDPVRTAQ